MTSVEQSTVQPYDKLLARIAELEVQRLHDLALLNEGSAVMESAAEGITLLKAQAKADAARIAELEGREVDLVERLRVAGNLLEAAAPIIRAITELGPANRPPGRAHDWLAAYQRTKGNGNG